MSRTSCRAHHGPLDRLPLPTLACMVAADLPWSRGRTLPPELRTRRRLADSASRPALAPELPAIPCRPIARPRRDGLSRILFPGTQAALSRVGNRRSVLFDCPSCTRMLRAPQRQPATACASSNGVAAEEVGEDARAAGNAGGKLAKERERNVDVGSTTVRRGEDRSAICLLARIVHRQHGAIVRIEGRGQVCRALLNPAVEIVLRDF